MFRSVVSLSVKLKEATVPSDIANPKQLVELAPGDLSFWVASLFAGNPYQVRKGEAREARSRAMLADACWRGRQRGARLHASATICATNPLPN